MQLYTQIVWSVCSLSPPSTLSSFPPLTALSLYFALLSVPATQVARPKQMALLACREAVNIARGDLGTQRSAASSASKASCFAAFPSEKKDIFFLGNQTLAVSHPTVKRLVITPYWFQNLQAAVGSRTERDYSLKSFSSVLHSVKEWVSAGNDHKPGLLL